jgi:hypothetical protein
MHILHIAVQMTPIAKVILFLSYICLLGTS